MIGAGNNVRSNFFDLLSMIACHASFRDQSHRFTVNNCLAHILPVRCCGADLRNFLVATNRIAVWAHRTSCIDRSVKLFFGNGNRVLAWCPR